MARAHLLVLLACVLTCHASEFEDLKDFITTYQQPLDDEYPVISGELSPFVGCDDCRQKRSIFTKEDTYSKWLLHKIKSNAQSRNRCPDGTIRYFHVCMPIRKLLPHRLPSPRYSNKGFK